MVTIPCTKIAQCFRANIRGAFMDFCTILVQKGTISAYIGDALRKCIREN